MELKCQSAGRGRSSWVRVRNCHTRGAHSGSFFCYIFSLLLAGSEELPQKDKSVVIELNIVEELKVLMESAEVEPWRCVRGSKE